MVTGTRIVGLLLLLVVPAWAADRYVARSGADVGDCSLSAAPCFTLGYALTQALSGDTVKMAAGSYQEGILIAASTSLVIAGGWSRDFSVQNPARYRTRVRALPGEIFGFSRTDAFTIFAPAGESISLTFDGLTIMRSFRGIVAAAYADGALQLSITRSILQANIMGGLEVFANGSGTVDVTVASSLVVANTAGRVSEEGCYTDLGAGLRAVGASLTMNLVDTTFRRNRIRGLPCGLGPGGGVYFAEGTLVVDGCVFSRNAAPGIGGGGDPGGAGGGLYARNANLQVTNTLFLENAAFRGGGLHAEGSGSATIVNSTFVGNTATRNDFAWGGGALIGGAGSITNTTFAGNRGGGVAAYAGAVVLRNSILWNNGAPSDLDVRGSATVDGDHNDIGVTTGSVNDLGGNISSDPLFASSDDVHLTAASPCVDAGTCTGAPATDFEGDPRPSGTGCDMGADERVP
jgi:hypothetical protein